MIYTNSIIESIKDGIKYWQSISDNWLNYSDNQRLFAQNKVNELKDKLLQVQKGPAHDLHFQ